MSPLLRRHPVLATADLDEACSSVGQVLHRCRFSQRYRAEFGLSPSRTLAS